MLKRTSPTSLLTAILLVLSAANAAQAQKSAVVSVDIPIVGIDLVETPKPPKQQPSDYLTLIGYRLDIGYGSPSEGVLGNYENVVWETYAYYSLEDESEAFLQYDLFAFWLFELDIIPSLIHPVLGTYGITVRLVPLFAIGGKEGSVHAAQIPKLDQPSW